MPEMGWEGGKCRANKTNKNIREVASINNLSRYKQRSEIAKTILDQSIEKTKPARVNKERKGLVWCTHLIPETTNTYTHTDIYTLTQGDTLAMWMQLLVMFAKDACSEKKLLNWALANNFYSLLYFYQFSLFPLSPPLSTFYSCFAFTVLQVESRRRACALPMSLLGFVPGIKWISQWSHRQPWPISSLCMYVCVCVPLKASAVCVFVFLILAVIS